MVETINELSDIISEIKEKLGVNQDAPLSDVLEALGKISIPVVETEQHLIILYTRALNDAKAGEKRLPEISWPIEDGKKAQVVIKYPDETKLDDYWITTVPSKSYENTGNKDASGNPIYEEERLYIRFIILNPGDSTSNETISGTIGAPICIEGKDGPQGPQGDRGENGIVVGMVQYQAAHLFLIQSRDGEKPSVPTNITYDYARIKDDYSHLAKPEYLKIGDNFVPETTSEKGVWARSYEKVNDANDCVWKTVVGYNSNSSDVFVTDPVRLSGDGISDYKELYYLSDSVEDVTGNEEGWGINWTTPTLDKPYLYNRTIVTYDSGKELSTKPVIISSLPNSIKEIEVSWGISEDINSEPTDWLDEKPSEYKVLWKKEVLTYTASDESVETKSPIAIKGNDGISPVNIVARIKSEEIDNWTLQHSDMPLQTAVIVDNAVWLWNGSNDPSGWTSDFYNVDSYYWIILGDMFTSHPNSDWNENDPNKVGYVHNRTHYKHIDETIIYWDYNNGENNVVDLSDYEDVCSIQIPGVCNLNKENGFWENNCIYNPNIKILDLPVEIDGITESNLEIHIQTSIKRISEEYLPDQIQKVFWNELKWLRDNHKLVPMRKYQIIDYTLYVKDRSDVSSGNIGSGARTIPFDIVVEAISESILSENAITVPHVLTTMKYGGAEFRFRYQDEYGICYWEGLIQSGSSAPQLVTIRAPFKSNKAVYNGSIVDVDYEEELQVTRFVDAKIKYCLDNDISRWSWAPDGGALGRGVIYHMESADGNEFPGDMSAMIYKSGAQMPMISLGSLNNKVICDNNLNFPVISVYGSNNHVELNVYDNDVSIQGFNNRIINSKLTAIANNSDNNTIIGSQLHDIINSDNNTIIGSHLYNIISCNYCVFINTIDNKSFDYLSAKTIIENIN